MFIKKYGPLVLSSFIGASACFVLTQTDLVSKAHAARNSQCVWIEGNSLIDFKNEFNKYIAEGWELKSANAFEGRVSALSERGANGATRYDNNWLWHSAVFCK